MELEDGTWRVVDGAVTEEGLVRVHVNGRELATLMCTPRDQHELVLGFLRAEGIIHSLEDVRHLVTCPNGTCVEAWLRDSAADPTPARRVITSGCGGGLTFDHLAPTQLPLNTHTQVTPEQLFARMHDLYQAAQLYRATQGIHTSALSDGDQLLLVAEDVGRHNTIDRLWGKALLQNIDPAGLILLATGRISSEMLSKAARMGVPIVASRTAATSLAVALGRAWNVTIAGYVRRGSLRVYSAAERVAMPARLAQEDSGR
jgi:FdhD protein